MARKRDLEVKTWMTARELEEVYRRMDELGIKNRGAFIRKMALNGYCIQLDLPEIKEMTSLLKRCSNNLNQYAKRANETGSIYETDIRDLQKMHGKILSMMGEILDRLSSI